MDFLFLAYLALKNNLEANEVDKILSLISRVDIFQEIAGLDLNQEKIGQIFKCIIDRKEGQYFIGRTEFDSPDVDNEVLIDASKFYVKTGEFVNVKIIDATEFDLYGEPKN
jgi:tRNA A37 methylthiotransferase MiaB